MAGLDQRFLGTGEGRLWAMTLHEGQGFLAKGDYFDIFPLGQKERLFQFLGM